MIMSQETTSRTPLGALEDTWNRQQICSSKFPTCHRDVRFKLFIGHKATVGRWHAQTIWI